MSGALGRVNKAGLVQKLYTRFGLLLGDPSARLELAARLLMVTNADELTSVLQTAVLSGLDTSQAAGVAIQVDTVPAGKQWKLMVLSGRRTTGAAALVEGYVLNPSVGGSANSGARAQVTSIQGVGGSDFSNTAGLGILMNPGDSLGVIIRTTEVASVFQVTFTYEERDIA